MIYSLFLDDFDKMFVLSKTSGSVSIAWYATFNGEAVEITGVSLIFYVRNRMAEKVLKTRNLR